MSAEPRLIDAEIELIEPKPLTGPNARLYLPNGSVGFVTLSSVAYREIEQLISDSDA
jgi:hypothetical protein